MRYHGDDKTTGMPIRLYHGIADDWVSIEPCRAYVARLQSAGAAATLTEYPNAYHAYDNFLLKETVKVPEAQTTRRCLLEEGQNGAILNSKTGKPYDLNSDTCVEKGTQVVYNAAAYEATAKAVKEFLVATFRLPAP